MFLGLPDPDPDPFVGTDPDPAPDPDPSPYKGVERTKIMLARQNFVTKF